MKSVTVPPRCASTDLQRSTKDLIVASLEQSGWQKDRIVDAFSKTFQTAIAPAKASVWLTFDHDYRRFWLKNADFTSAGENVLAATFAIFPEGMAEDEIHATVSALVTGMESKIAGAFSVRQLRV